MKKLSSEELENILFELCKISSWIEVNYIQLKKEKNEEFITTLSSELNRTIQLFNPDESMGEKKEINQAIYEK